MSSRSESWNEKAVRNTKDMKSLQGRGLIESAELFTVVLRKQTPEFPELMS